MPPKTEAKVIDLDEKYRENREKRRANRKSYGPVKVLGAEWMLHRPNQALFLGVAEGDASVLMRFLASFVQSVTLPDGTIMEGIEAAKRFRDDMGASDDYADIESIVELLNSMIELTMEDIPTPAPSSSGAQLTSIDTSSTAG